MGNYVLEFLVGGVMSAGTTFVFTRGKIGATIVSFIIGGIVAIIGCNVGGKQQEKQPEQQ